MKRRLDVIKTQSQRRANEVGRSSYLRVCMQIDQASGSDSTLKLSLRRLVIVRAVAIIGELLALALVPMLGLAIDLPLLGLGLMIAMHFLVTLVAGWRVRQAQNISSTEFWIQLSLDVVILTGLLFLVGGATNPFVSLLLLPLVVAATLLPKLQVWCMAGMVVLAYGLLMFDFQPMTGAGHAMHGGHGGEEFEWHVIGMWFGFLLSVALIVLFVLRLAESLRERERVLAEARERAMRDEQLVMLGTLAAGAAHELGTPLSTMAVLSKELMLDNEADADMQRSLGLLRQQVDRCKETLAMISASSGQLRAESGSRLRLDQFLDKLIADWQAVRPKARLRYQATGETPAPMIVAEQGLRQALLNFLDNAADSCDDAVEMQCDWTAEKLRCEILDRGAGLPFEFQDQIGKLPFTTKADGHGLGLLLAHSIIQRLGGEVDMQARPGGGTQVLLKISLEGLKVDE